MGMLDVHNAHIHYLRHSSVAYTPERPVKADRQKSTAMCSNISCIKLPWYKSYGPHDVKHIQCLGTPVSRRIATLQHHQTAVVNRYLDNRQHIGTWQRRI